MKGLLITPEFEVDVYEPRDGNAFQVDELQFLVGGEFEILRSRVKDWALVVNEDGKRRELPVNELATALYVHGHLGKDNQLRGTVLFVDEDEL